MKSRRSKLPGSRKECSVFKEEVFLFDENLDFFLRTSFEVTLNPGI